MGNSISQVLQKSYYKLFEHRNRKKIKSVFYLSKNKNIDIFIHVILNFFIDRFPNTWEIKMSAYQMPP